MNGAAHIPVMAREALEALNPVDGGVYIDATFGAGGYARRMLDAADCTVYAFDRDPRAVAAAADLVKAFEGRLILINRPFDEMEEAVGEHGVSSVDGIVFDLGVSSMQLDEGERGFSFRKDGPLSMRMDAGSPDAANVVATADESELAAIFKTYGEERNARRLARAIIKEREAAPIETTSRLAALIEDATPKRGAQKIHPATRVFQALRIFVNDELGQLRRALRAAERLLKPAGRLVVVTFHSLEDRIVKRFFGARTGDAPRASRHAPETAAPLATFRLLNRKALAASDAEANENPRARSAKLRAGERLAGPALETQDDLQPDFSFCLSDFQGEPA
ncbi:MAG: 16S rRNA (cytosine(1402)-N(4))-methyltransferase RsmH [Pseudomonadota bacterium]